ncbi:hypothetical protein [Laspinema palackyanum]|uniref:hypothetical protein n=1 Tax=Laspinema palackyanum TaxID=3231601 RepID=UPI00345D77B2|nr:hypothetical protein [Laspinema sp. D2c]
MIKRFIAALLVLTVTFFGCIQPSYAATQYNNESATSESQYDNGSEGSNLLFRCWNLNPANAAEKLICDNLQGLVSTVATLATVTGTCYAIDAGITVVIPPAALLAPLCNTAGAAGSAGVSLARQGVQALAH